MSKVPKEEQGVPISSWGKKLEYRNVNPIFTGRDKKHTYYTQGIYLC
jgi:hypothetical protein